MSFDQNLIKKAEQGELSALVGLDQQGLIIGAEENLEQYIQRLQCLQKNTAVLRESLAKEGKFEVEGIAVEADKSIPEHIFAEAQETTRDLYCFSIDWVPGFFITPSFGWLFGGCAFYFFPDFFALFIIRKSFINKEKWLIYSRRELLAHELCHIARIGLGSRLFEENFAYQTATSRFRRLLGPVFRSPTDSFLLLLGTMVLLLMQTLRVLFFPQLWIWPFWSLVGGIFAYLAARVYASRKILRRARKNIAAVSSYPDAVLFRCTDQELIELGQLKDLDAFQKWLMEQVRTKIRWKIITRRFMQDGT